MAVGYVLLLLLLATADPLAQVSGCTSGSESNLHSRLPARRFATAVMAFPWMVRAPFGSRSRTLTLVSMAAARTLGAQPLDRFFTITLPLMLPGVIAGAVTAFAAGLGEFGAVIPYAANIPGQTRTIPLALYTAIQSPDGDAQALRLALMSFALGLIGLLLAEVLARRARALVGR